MPFCNGGRQFGRIFLVGFGFDFLYFFQFLVVIAAFDLFSGRDILGTLGFLNLLVDFFVVIVVILRFFAVFLFAGWGCLRLRGFLADGGQFTVLGWRHIIEIKKVVLVLLGLLLLFLLFGGGFGL